MLTACNGQEKIRYSEWERGEREWRTVTPPSPYKSVATQTEPEPASSKPKEPAKNPRQVESTPTTEVGINSDWE